MQSPTSLQARVLHLESENADLSLAASEAASLAEEYAADAAAYRRTLTSASSSDALLTELSDAARRKDRRILRLTSLLEAEKHTVHALQTNVIELTELSHVADEMEDTLRKSLAALQRRLAERDRDDHAPHDPNSLKQDARIAHAVANLLSQYLPASASISGDLTAFAALRIGVSTMHLALSLRARLSSSADTYGARADDFARLAAAICACVHFSLRWCFAAPETIAERGPPVERELKALHERTSALCEDMSSSEDVCEWTEDFAKMKVELVSMAVERLGALGGWEGAGEDVVEVELLVEEVLRVAGRRAREVAGGLRKCEEGGGEKEGEMKEIRKMLEMAREMVRRKERDIEDLKVRNSVFEERVAVTLDEAKEIAALRQRVAGLEKELTEAKENLVADRDREGQAECRDVKNDDKDAPARAPRYLEAIDEARESATLRRVLVHRQLADLQRVPLSTNANAEQLTSEKNRQAVRETVRVALQNARAAASNARAIRLDADTLRPKTRGATMSRKQILQARTLADRHLSKDVARRSIPEGARMVQLKLSNENEDVHAIADVLRLSLCL